MLAQAAAGASSTDLLVPIMSALVGIVAGAVLSHLLERRRWRIEARKDAYVRFAMTADHFRTEASKIRNLLQDRVTNYLFGRLHEALEELRPAYYELRLLAPAGLARIAETIYVSADEFVENIDPQGSGWGVDPPVFADEYITLYRRFAPLHEDVDAFVELARLDLTVETRAARAVRGSRMAYRRLRGRLRRRIGVKQRRVAGDE